MATKRWLGSAGVLVVTALIAAPRGAQAQAAEPSAATRALLGTPAGSSGFANLEVMPDRQQASPAERGLLGASSGVRVTLDTNVERGRRSAGEAALLGH
jgi:hypothetical protein